MRYSLGRKEAILRKLLPPMSKRLDDVAAEKGISKATLYAWGKEARMQGRLVPDGDSASGWTAKDKFARWWRRPE